jgi:hypothetical protein
MAQYFTPGQRTLISVPNIGQDVYVRNRSLSITPPHSSDYYLSDVMLAALNEEEKWPFVLFRPLDMITYPSDSKHFGKKLPIEQHVIIVWIVENKGESPLTLIYNMKYIKNRVMFTSKSRFLIVVFHDGIENKNVRRIMFNEIVSILVYNVIFVIPSSPQESEGFKTTDLFTWFPYRPIEFCGKFKEIVRIDQWLQEYEGRFLNGVDLYPNKAPKDFQRCPIKVAQYQLTFRISRLLEPVEAYVVRTIFSSLNLKISTAKAPDIVFGGVTLNFFGKISKSAVTFPHLFTTLKWYVPCAKHIPRQGNFTKVFAWSLWLAMALVSLTSVLVTFWMYKGCSETRSLSECFLTVWAVTLGVSVPQIPRRCELRVFFLFSVCYSLAISTVFQCFFTSFLVDPGLQDQISSMEEMVQSGIAYGIPRTEEFLWCNMTQFNRGVCDRVTVSQTNKLLYYRNFIETGDSALLAYDLEMDVVLSCLKKTRACSVSNGFIEVMFAVSFTNGTKSVLYEPFNAVVIRMFEAGITEKLKNDCFAELRRSWQNSFFITHLKEEMRKQNFSLENSTDSGNIYDNTDEYFVFSTSHLRMAFYMFGLGNAMSLVVFIGEKIYKRI